VVHGKLMVIFGGVDHTMRPIFYDMSILDLDTWTWRTVAVGGIPSVVASHLFQVTDCDTVLLMLGFEVDQDCNIHRMRQLDSTAPQWSTERMHESGAPRATGSRATATINGTVIVVGGCDKSRPEMELWVLHVTRETRMRCTDES
jgi:hypothetical protein